MELIVTMTTKEAMAFLRETAWWSTDDPYIDELNEDDSVLNIRSLRHKVHDAMEEAMKA
jgi:hypothetical protein